MISKIAPEILRRATMKVEDLILRGNMKRADALNALKDYPGMALADSATLNGILNDVYAKKERGSFQGTVIKKEIETKENVMLSNIGNKIFAMKYTSHEGETWDQACHRVADYIASAEKNFGITDEKLMSLSSRFFHMINELYFIPGGRVLANAGNGKSKNLMNCFVLPIEDSRESIYGTLKNAAEIFAAGGGIGFNFSDIREEGADIKGTGGQASGPLSFMTLFDQTGEVIQQASRRGAQMGMLDIDHPDIEKFIDFKSEPNSRSQRVLDEYHRNLALVGGQLKNTKYYEVLRKTLLDDQLTHFNTSVVITDEFIEKVLNDHDFALRSRGSGLEPKVVKAKNLLMRMATKAWESGDPGVFFIDRVNEDNMVPYLGQIRVTNPCGEVPLLPYEPCCLGSLNLMRFYNKEQKEIDFVELEGVIRLAVRFLDDVQEISETPIKEINDMAKGLRRIGLGVMGFADLLAMMDIPYDSADGLKLAQYLSWFITFFAWQGSINLGEQRGAFPLYDKDKVNLDLIKKIYTNSFTEKLELPIQEMLEEIRNMGVRNVSVTSIAPTGSIALIAGVNSSIEPFFSLAYKRYITEGVGNIAKDYIIEINPILFSKLEEAGLSEKDLDKVRKHMEKTGSIQECPEIPEKIKNVFRTASEIQWNSHVDMQYSWQEYVTNAVSKTINCTNETTIEDIYKIYLYMWNCNLKGGTIYRDGSKSFQILNKGTK